MAKRSGRPHLNQILIDLGIGPESFKPPKVGDERFYSDLKRVAHDQEEFLHTEKWMWVEQTGTWSDYRQQVARSELQLPSVGESIVSSVCGTHENF